MPLKCPRRRCGKPLQATVRTYVDVGEDGVVTNSELGCEVQVYCENDHEVYLHLMPVADRPAFDDLLYRLGSNSKLIVPAPTAKSSWRS